MKLVIMDSMNPVIFYFFLMMMKLTAYAKESIGVVRKENKFGAVNFERISGYVLVNATYLTLENINLISCISECKSNKGCNSLNFRKKSSGETICELNEISRYAAESEKNFQKQPDSEHYEIKSPCKKMVCYNGGRCHVNYREETHQCRCPLQYSGDHCELRNPHTDKIHRNIGIVNGELFLAKGSFNHAMGKTVCEAFGADLATKNDLSRIAVSAGFGWCGRAWIKSGGLGYPEYIGSCHSGSTSSGYYSHACCEDKVMTYSNAWCIKKNIDFCKPEWYAHGKYCYLFRDDDLLTWNEANLKCTSKNAKLAKLDGQFKFFAKRVCPWCSSMHVGAKKMETWKWIPQYFNGDIPVGLWSSNEPQGDDTCVEWNTELDGLKPVPCTARRGYICRISML